MEQMSSTEYVYLVAKPIGREAELIKAESVIVTGAKPSELGVTTSGTLADIKQGAFISSVIKVLISGDSESIDNQIGRKKLYRKIGELGLQSHNFCVRLIKRPKKMKLDFDQFKVARNIGARIGGSVNLNQPATEFWLLLTPNNFWFGRLETSADKRWVQFNKRPHTSSSSLPARIARAMINLTIQSNGRLLDPCCGTGTILLEGANMGLSVFGADLNPKMVFASQKNLDHFGLMATVATADARNISHHTFDGMFDAIITDLPYGFALVADTERDRHILANVRHLAPKATFVSTRNLSSDLEDFGYKIKRIVRIPKYDHFVRLVFITDTK